MGKLGEIATEGLQCRGLALLAVSVADILEFTFVLVGSVARKIRIELAKNLIAGSFDIDLKILKDTCCDSVTFTKKTEKNVLGSHIAVI